MRESRKSLRDQARQISIQCPGQRLAGAGAELAARHQDDVACARQALQRPALQQVGSDRLEPAPPAACRRPGSVNRATPMTRRCGAALRARRARVGPIFPPTPRIRMSPSAAARSAHRSGSGAAQELFELLDARRSARAARSSADFMSGLAHCFPPVRLHYASTCHVTEGYSVGLCPRGPLGVSWPSGTGGRVQRGGVADMRATGARCRISPRGDGLCCVIALDLFRRHSAAGGDGRRAIQEPAIHEPLAGARKDTRTSQLPPFAPGARGQPWRRRPSGSR